MDFDGAYNEALFNPELMASFIEHVAGGAVQAPKLNYLQQESLLKSGAHRHDDLIVEIEDEARSTFIVEIQSQPDKEMYSRMMEYTYEYHRRCLEQDGKLYPTCAVVYYIGGSKWSAPTGYRFQSPNSCRPSMQFEYELIDVQRICPENGLMIPTTAFGVFMMLTGHLKYTEVYRKLKEFDEKCPTILTESLRKTFVRFIRHLNIDKEFAEALINYLEGDKIMAESLWNLTLKKELAEEREKGFREGDGLKSREMIHRMGKKYPISEIADIVELPISEVEKILNEGA